MNRFETPISFADSECAKARCASALSRNNGRAAIDGAMAGAQNSAILRTLALLATFFVYTAGRIVALDPTSRISQYGHSVWRVQDGYFGGKAWAVTQTTDGYIWVGTDAGLFRFDGVRFVRWSAQAGEELPSNRIVSLLGARDGSLWIGMDTGLAHLVSNRLILFEKNERWPISYILEDRDANIWIDRYRPQDRTHPLCQVVGTILRCYGRKEGVEANGGGALAQDSSGNLWVGSNTTLTRWRRPGDSTVYRPKSLQSNAGSSGVMALLPAADGSLWVGMSPGRGAGLQHMVEGALKPFRAPNLNGETLDVLDLHADHQNGIWVGTSQGLYRICGMDVDHYASDEGLSSDYVNGIFEDREGNVWIATPQGLDMFRDLPVKSISKREGLSSDTVQSVAASRDGTVWIGTNRLQVLRHEEVSLEPGKALPGDQVTSILEDHAGRLWAGMNNTLFVYERGGFRQIRRQNGTALGMVSGIAEDSEHNVWVEAFVGTGGTLFQIQDLKVRQEFSEPEVPLARRIVADPQGGIWLGLANGDLARYRTSRVDTFTFGNHPNSHVWAMTAASDGSILGATGFGVLGWKDGKQQILTVRNGLPCNNIGALISDDAANLWLHTLCGLIEIPKDQIQFWWDHPEARLQLRVFDAFDGARAGLASFTNSAKTPDGRLWFANGSVVQMVDPAHIQVNTLPPPVDINGLVADHKTYSLDPAIRLPPLTRDVEIDYAALSYVVPQKVLFRYRLEGHDPGWQEPGTRRQAFYSDLRPGHYHFRVIACNNDGVWNEAGAALDFSILPAYYQTAWFRAICGAAFLLLLWAIYQFRVQQLQRQFAIGFEARVNERTRIARELHDTLLQSLHGLMFQFQGARNLLPRRPDDAMRSLDDAIGETKKALAESRDAIQGLRLEPMATGNLADLLMSASRELATSAADPVPPVFDLIEEGDQQRLSRATSSEICRIALEILRNAYRHAHARRIEAEIRYGDDVLRLRIRDDGRGIDPNVLKEGGRLGHWGLRGTRERAERIGARVDFWSELGEGTEVELAIPAAVAYENTRDSYRAKLLRKVTSRAHRS